MMISDPQLAALIGLFGGVLLGVAAVFGRFCTLGALEDAFYANNFRRLQSWALALAISITAIALIENIGWVGFDESMYRQLAWNPVASLLGGVMFGYGMALSGNCGYGALVRMASGDIRSFVIVLVMGISAYMAIGGPVAWLRAPLFATMPAEAPPTIPAMIGLPNLWVALAMSVILLMLAFWARAAWEAPKALFSGVMVAIAIISGWVGSAWLSAENLGSTPTVSHTFSAPIGEALLTLMTATGSELSFAVGSVAGVLVGAFIAARFSAKFRWEACDDPRELGRQMFGAFLMGTGAVIALGCSVGQGLSAFALMSISAPVTLAAIVFGAWLGLRWLIEGRYAISSYFKDADV